jgi:hypothetical protein
LAVPPRRKRISASKPDFRNWRPTRRRRLPKPLMVCSKSVPWGHVAEWSRNGLQNPYPSTHCHRNNTCKIRVSSVFHHLLMVRTATKTATPTSLTLLYPATPAGQARPDIDQDHRRQSSGSANLPGLNRLRSWTGQDFCSPPEGWADSLETCTTQG